MLPLMSAVKGYPLNNNKTCTDNKAQSETKNVDNNQ